MEIVAADIGGTHARFALAEVMAGRVVALGEVTVLKTAEHASMRLAWEAFAATLEQRPRAAAVAVATPIAGEVLRFTNNPWMIQPARLADELGVDACVLINDFGAVGHAVAQAPAELLAHVCGPDRALGSDGIVSIVGPGTGLGVACVVRRGESYDVIETEGGHGDFASLDPVDDHILAFLRPRFGRVSTERVVSGPGLANIHQALAAMEEREVAPRTDAALWAAAFDGADALVAAALDRFCLSFGAVAGDIALVQGASAVVIAGGLGSRLADHLSRSGFARRFTAKGRFAERMASIPVRLITHAQPGLFGAAAAFAKEHAR